MVATSIARAKLVSLILRAGGMAGRFVLILFLARRLAPEELGTYGLISATIAFCLYLLGLDFYTYAGREIARAGQDAWPSMLRDQFALYATSYVVIFPWLGCVFLAGLLSPDYAVVFYAILLSEHLSQECVRVLIVTGRPALASGVLFLRSGGWTYVLMGLVLAGVVPLDLTVTLWFWVAGNALSILWSIWGVRALAWHSRTARINWSWIRKGLGAASVLLVGTLALRVTSVLDRVFVETLVGREQLGVYTLYFSIANCLLGLLDAMVFSFHFPKLVAVYARADFSEFSRARREFRNSSLGATALFAGGAAAMFYPAVLWIGNSTYLAHAPTFFVLLISTMLLTLTYIPHYELYAMGEDSTIVRAHVAGAVTFIVASLGLGRSMGMAGVAVALLASTAVLGLLKQTKVSALREQRGIV